MAKINKTQSNKKIKLPNLKRKNNKVAVLKVHSIDTRAARKRSSLEFSSISQVYNISTLETANCIRGRLC